MVSLGAEVGRGRAALGEVAREDRLKEGAEDDLGTTRSGVSSNALLLRDYSRGK